MKTSSDYRFMARESLSGRWTGAVLATLLTFLLSICASFSISLFTNPKMMALLGFSFSAIQAVILSWLVLIILLFMLQPLSFAYIYSFRRMRQSEQSIWACMKVPYGKAVLASILYSIFFCVAIFLSVLTIALISFLFKSVVVMGLLCIPVFVYGIYLYYSFVFYPMFVVDNPDMALYDCFVLCYRTMKGKRFELILLDLSFIGWYLLNILSFGLATLWVRPYHYAARAAFYEDLIAKNENKTTDKPFITNP